MPIKDENEENSNLVDGLSDNMLKHDRGDDVVRFLIRRFIEKFFSGGFGGKGKSGQTVHDEVDPQHLNSRKNGFVKNNGSNESGNDSNNINSQLEHNEFSNGIVDISAPFNSLNNGSKIIVHDQNGGGLFGNFSSRYVHGQANTCFTEGRSVICAVASDRNNIVTFL